MKRENYLFIIGISIGLFVITGCEKDKSEIELCNITKIRVGHRYHPAEGVFTYNSHGNPVSVRFTHTRTGSPNFEFKYDAFQRLTECIRPYNNEINGFELWSKYTYDDNNRVVADTLYFFGTLGPEPTDYKFKHITKYYYDAQGRIIKTVEFHPSVPENAFVVTYDYDASGNLIIPGVTYDNKVNLHRTNKVWMFIDRDYSRNNPLIAQSYNSLGLPLQIRIPDKLPGYNPYFLNRQINDADIEYMCK